jgi:hypothetical protein
MSDIEKLLKMSDLERLVIFTAEAFALTPLILVSKTRIKKHSKARHVMAFVARSVLFEKLENVGHAFERDHTTILHSCRIVRENPEKFQPELGQITRALVGTAPLVSQAREIAYLRLRNVALEAEVQELRLAAGTAHEVRAA